MSEPVKHVQRVLTPEGAEYLYLRKKGLPRVKLRSPWPPDGQEAGSALEREVQSLIRQLTGAAVRPDSLRAYLRAYELEDAGFRSLEDSTKGEYRRYLGEFDEHFGVVPVSAFSPAYCKQLRDTWAEQGHRAANLRRQVLKNVLQLALIDGRMPTNPWADVGEIARPRHLADPHIIWPAEVLEIVITAAIGARKFGIARALALARYTGARRGDLVRISSAARAGGRVRFTSGKRRVVVDIPEDPELTRWLATTPDAQPLSRWQAWKRAKDGAAPLKPLTLVYGLSNRPYTEDGLGQELAQLVGDLAAAGTIPSAAFDLHGLRHTRGVELAIAGCTDAQGAAMLGHSSASSFAQYRRQADRILMADDADEKVRALRERAANRSEKRGVKQV